MSEQDWEGIAGNGANHRTVGPHRAWCKCGEWCYPNSHCPCCMETEGYEVRWSHPDNPLLTRAEWEASISGPLYRPGPKFDHPVLQRELRDIVAHGGLLEEDS